MADAEHPGMRDREAAVAIRLLVSSGQSPLRVVPVLKECLTIGRRPYNDIALDDLTVSGEHALVRVRNGEVVVHDLGSRNGTLVNGMPAAADEPQPLPAQAPQELGALLATQALPPSVRTTWAGVSINAAPRRDCGLPGSWRCSPPPPRAHRPGPWPAWGRPGG